MEWLSDSCQSLMVIKYLFKCMHVLMTQSDKGINEKYILDQVVKFNGI